MNFTDFYTAIHGYPPYPWQQELAEHISKNPWPENISAPTGAGKTSVLDIAVWNLSQQAQSSNRTAPLRIVHTVERKLIVDDAHRHARKIAERIDNAPELREVRTALRSLLPEFMRNDSSHPTVLVTSMHGESTWNDLWWRPVGCSIITGTMTQIVSRVLYRGVGESPYMQPISAAVLGTDAIRFIDEPHLLVPAVHTLREQGALVQHRTPITVALGATLPETLRSTPEKTYIAQTNKNWNNRTFRCVDLGDTAENTKLAQHIVDEAHKEYKRLGGNIVIIVSSIDLAQRVATKLSTRNVHTVTSHIRPYDRNAIPTIPSAEGIIVATQTLEVGVDYDAKCIISDLAPLPTLLQRAGRAGRRGGEATFTTIANIPNASDPRTYVYGEKALLETYKIITKDNFQFNTINIHDEQYRNTWTPEPARVPLEEEMTDLLFDTTAKAPWETFLHGLHNNRSEEVTLVWRDSPDLIDLVAPTAPESITVSYQAALALLSGSAKNILTDYDTIPSGQAPKSLKTPLPYTAYATRRRGKGDITPIRTPSDLQPGVTLALPTEAGLYSPTNGISVKNTAPVQDLVLHTRPATSKWRIVPLAALVGKEKAEKFFEGDIELEELNINLHPQAHIVGKVVYLPQHNDNDSKTEKENLVTLADHLEQVGNWARETAHSAQTHVDPETFYIAGLHHDIGKVLPEFQKEILGNTSMETPLAKSTSNSFTPTVRTLPSPWRHETGIAQALHKAGHTTASWLVADHHGRGYIHPHGNICIQATTRPEYGSCWDASALSALLRYADWMASATPEHYGHKLNDLNLIPVDHSELFRPETQPQQHPYIHKLTGLISSPYGGLLAAHGAYAAVYKKDPTALIRFQNGVAHISTTQKNIEWEPLFTEDIIAKNHVCTPKHYWYTDIYYTQTETLRLATAMHHNNGNIAAIAQTNNVTTEIFTDQDAGWDILEKCAFPIDTPYLPGDIGGYNPALRLPIAAWAMAAQQSWGAAQSKHGSGTHKNGKYLCIPTPAQWSSLDLTRALARRGIDGQWMKIQTYKTSDKQKTWVPTTEHP